VVTVGVAAAAVAPTRRTLTGDRQRTAEPAEPD
jgi:hypothetical protein